MKSQKLITALMLMLPGLSWGGATVPPPQIPEPEILALLAVGGVAAAAIKFMKRKK
jgi:uncharacterized membrane protein